MATLDTAAKFLIYLNKLTLPILQAINGPTKTMIMALGYTLFMQFNISFSTMYTLEQKVPELSTTCFF